ncbi:MAG: RNA polymerase factor sigma-54 [Gammaproteobacteria bacterium]|nr:RNA polymerase factor sigma-54 [Gammaproteobacteria bacterium]
MKQSIQLRLGQHLTMTPQLQQAIRLLQLSTLELQMEIQQALDSNLMLEAVDGTEPETQTDTEDSRNEADAETAAETATEAAETSAETEYSQADSDLGTTATDIPEDLPVDTGWDDIYDSGATSYSAPAGDDDRDYLETHNSGSESLQEHLTWQMEMSPFTDTDQAIATAIIDSINDDGYLGMPLEDIHQGLLESHPELEFDEVEAVLHRIQHFDPIGVGARSPGECLEIQLKQLDPDTPWRDTALKLIQQHLDLLGGRDYQQLMRRLKLSQPELQEVIALIQTLNPRPGSAISTATAEYVIPDVFVHKDKKGQWRVELNPDAVPKLRINSQYAGMVKRADNSADNNYLRNHLQEARWFIKSLQSRNETLLKVGRCIVERQRAFFDYGEEAMKPLVLRDVAEAVDMHESTISRVTTQKYMHTPRGIYEFKYFFSSHVGTADGGECSATAIRAMIKKLVAGENPAKPLSDSKIADLLSDEGINVARRTIAKYREAMAIPPSNERKRLA